jgi:TonB family protein
VGGQLEEPIVKVPPVYPLEAKAENVQGTVALHALISKLGTIEALQVISGPPMLRAAALDAVKKWKYRPHLVNGEPVEVETTISVNFSLTVTGVLAGMLAPPPVAPASEDDPVRVRPETMARLLLEHTPPVCSPPVEPGASATVVLHATISTEGMVKDVRVASGARSVRECTLEAVRRWRYQPYLVDGVPKQVSTTIVLNPELGPAATPAGAPGGK